MPAAAFRDSGVSRRAFHSARTGEAAGSAATMRPRHGGQRRRAAAQHAAQRQRCPHCMTTSCGGADTHTTHSSESNTRRSVSSRAAAVLAPRAATPAQHPTMSSPSLAQQLYRYSPETGNWLRALHARGLLADVDAAAAFCATNLLDVGVQRTECRGLWMDDVEYIPVTSPDLFACSNCNTLSGHNCADCDHCVPKVCARCAGESFCECSESDEVMKIPMVSLVDKSEK